MKLGALFREIPTVEKLHWKPNLTIQKITSDSRAVEPGDLFVACAGSRMDGHDFLTQAILAKAAAVVYENLPEITISRNVAAIRVKSSQATLAMLINCFYHRPDKDIDLVGVTGTNGKTTISYLLHRLLSSKTSAAYMGTLWYELPSQRISALNTTPGPEILIPLLDQMRRAKVKACVMEVSSHALDQSRVFGLEFGVAIFTQLSQDHLDYHKDLEQYFAAKRRLFLSEPPPRQCLINRDCRYGRRLIEVMPSAKTYGLEAEADYMATDIVPSLQGNFFKFRYRDQQIPVQIRLPLKHNVSNTVAVLGGLDLLGYDPREFLDILKEMPGIPGRMERITGASDFDVFVDYAHTPDAFESVLGQAHDLAPRRVLTLFGCGGDRDRAKRPLMTRAACRYSDIVIFTSDNPRSEDPEEIFSDMRRGLPKGAKERPDVLEIPDRAEAIERLVTLAEPGDVLFILGKGHEDYQILGEKKIPFDDRAVARECLKRKTRVFLS
ncbi:MAG: UDP-N-acetylmuramoyl-L-alanyl-D-glutamate--2,6-diaminopimelate ligase [Candidatus Omnitrophota bacterium]|nr:UDP-N-acetylmuramoyl-L-alanyl-D-glutamate--2,6-diaminopimelate ligase [Candidatus Omnitrophota bacterium]